MRALKALSERAEEHEEQRGGGDCVRTVKTPARSTRVTSGAGRCDPCCFTREDDLNRHDILSCVPAHSLWKTPFESLSKFSRRNKRHPAWTHVDARFRGPECSFCYRYVTPALSTRTTTRVIALKRVHCVCNAL